MTAVYSGAKPTPTIKDEWVGVVNGMAGLTCESFKFNFLVFPRSCSLIGIGSICIVRSVLDAISVPEPVVVGLIDSSDGGVRLLNSIGLIRVSVLMICV